MLQRNIDIITHLVVVSNNLQNGIPRKGYQETIVEAVKFNLNWHEKWREEEELRLGRESFGETVGQWYDTECFGVWHEEMSSWLEERI